MLERVQVANVPARDPISAGVQDPPKLSVKVKTWNVVPQVLRPPGQANRKASCWRSGSRCLKKRMPCCNGRDIE